MSNSTVLCRLAIHNDIEQAQYVCCATHALKKVLNEIGLKRHFVPAPGMSAGDRASRGAQSLSGWTCD